MANAEARTTLAALLASDPRPVYEVLTDAIHTLDSVHLSKVDEHQSADGHVDAEALTELIGSARGATSVSLAATRTAAWNAIAQSHERRVNIEAAHIAAVLESSLAGLWPWLTSLGLSDADLNQVKRSVALGLRASLEAVSTAPRDRDGRPQLPSAEPPSDVDSYVLIDRAELESMRNTIMRLRPSLDSKPADVFVPDDTDITPPDSQETPGSTSHGRPIGLVSSTATRHYTGR